DRDTAGQPAIGQLYAMAQGDAERVPPGHCKGDVDRSRSGPHLGAGREQQILERLRAACRLEIRAISEIADRDAAIEVDGQPDLFGGQADLLTIALSRVV